MTAEEFFRNKIKEETQLKEPITLSQIILNAEQTMRWANEYAKLEVKNALERACENVKFDYSDIDIINDLIRDSYDKK